MAKTMTIAGHTYYDDPAAVSAGNVASGERGTTNHSEFDTEQYDSVIGVLVVTAKAGTSPTLDVKLETQVEDDSDWFTVGSFAQVTGATSLPATLKKEFGPVGKKSRWVGTVGGTDTPLWTYAITASAQ